MSLDIYLTDKKTGDEVADMNWFRNPFGLCQWAEDNYEYVNGHEGKKSLWYVCNHWSYAKSGRVNRKLFKDVVHEYWDTISFIKQGYFFFNLPSYRQFIEGKLNYLPGNDGIFNRSILGQKYDIKSRLLIPMEHFGDRLFGISKHTLDDYREWFKELLWFAELLQDKNNRFYCSN